MRAPRLTCIYISLDRLHYITPQSTAKILTLTGVEAEQKPGRSSQTQSLLVTRLGDIDDRAPRSDVLNSKIRDSGAVTELNTVSRSQDHQHGFCTRGESPLSATSSSIVRKPSGCIGMAFSISSRRKDLETHSPRQATRKFAAMLHLLSCSINVT